MIASHHTCSLNFCPECENAGFCDRSCGYCTDPCVGRGPSVQGVSPTPATTSPHPPNLVLLSFACFISFFCACTVVFIALTKRRVHARLGIATNRAGGRSSGGDDDVITVDATFTGFQVDAQGLPAAVPSWSGQSGTIDGLDAALVVSSESPVVVVAECDDTLVSQDSTPGLGTSSLILT